MLLKNVKIVNPKTNYEGISDIRIEDSYIKEIAQNIKPKSHVGQRRSANRNSTASFT